MMYMLLAAALLAISKGAANLTAKAVLFDQIEIVKIFDDVDQNLVKMEIEGPTDKWVGIGFNGTDMNNTYAIVCSGSGSTMGCQENILGYGSPGTQLKAEIKVVTDEVKNGVRVVVIERKRTDTGAGYFNFPASPTTINIIAAIGTTNTFDSKSSMANSTKTTLQFVASK
eukprot:761985_1